MTEPHLLAPFTSLNSPGHFHGFNNWAILPLDIITVNVRWRFTSNCFRPSSSEILMKAILSAAMVLGFCGLTGARDEKADPVGTWQCEYEIGKQKRTSTLMIKKEGDKFVGTMSWPDQKDEKLKDPKFKDGKLTFTADRKIMDNTITIEYTLTIDGDKFKGKGAADFGGQKQEYDIAGKREKKDK
jgi:hypothetical protein